MLPSYLACANLGRWGLRGGYKVTLLDWRKKGLVPFYRLGKRIYFKAEEVIEALGRVPKVKGRR
jgi:hypothetical protein